MPPAEPDLVARARRGDREAFSRLALPHRPAIAAAVRDKLAAALRQRLDIDDLVQETLLRALLAIDSLQWQSEEALRGWLLAIADNVAREAHRRHIGTRSRDVRREALPADEVAREIDTPDPQRLLRREERFARLTRALRQLSPDHRQVIALARLEGLSLAEVGTRMGRSSAATSALLLRALQQLRQHFEPTESLRLPARELRVDSRSEER